MKGEWDPIKELELHGRVELHGRSRLRTLVLFPIASQKTRGAGQRRERDAPTGGSRCVGIDTVGWGSALYFGHAVLCCVCYNCVWI